MQRQASQFKAFNKEEVIGEYVQFVDVTIGERHCALPPLHKMKCYSQLATSRSQVCSSRGKRARCMAQAHVMEILQSDTSHVDNSNVS